MMHKTSFSPLKANVAYLGDLNDDDGIGLHIPKDDHDIFTRLPPDCTSVDAMGTEPTSIGKAFHGPNAYKLQAALNYEISQLEKF